MDTTLLNQLVKETEKEKREKSKKKPVFSLRKEKPLNYYSGWSRK